MNTQTQEPLQISVAHQGPDSVVTLAGSADIDQGESLREQLLDAAHTSNGSMILDMRALTFICSTWLGTLIRAHNDVERHGGQLRLVAPNTHILNILQTTQLTRLMPVFPTIDQAIAKQQ